LKVSRGGGAAAQLQEPIHRGTFSEGPWSAASQRRSRDVVSDGVDRISPTDEDDEFDRSVFTCFEAMT